MGATSSDKGIWFGHFTCKTWKYEHDQNRATRYCVRINVRSVAFHPVRKTNFHFCWKSRRPSTSATKSVLRDKVHDSVARTFALRMLNPKSSYFKGCWLLEVWPWLLSESSQMKIDIVNLGAMFPFSEHVLFLARNGKAQFPRILVNVTNITTKILLRDFVADAEAHYTLCS